MLAALGSRESSCPPREGTAAPEDGGKGGTLLSRSGFWGAEGAVGRASRLSRGGLLPCQAEKGLEGGQAREYELGRNDSSQGNGSKGGRLTGPTPQSCRAPFPGAMAQLSELRTPSA